LSEKIPMNTRDQCLSIQMDSQFCY